MRRLSRPKAPLWVYDRRSELMTRAFTLFGAARSSYVGAGRSRNPRISVSVNTGGGAGSKHVLDRLDRAINRGRVRRHLASADEVARDDGAVERRLDCVKVGIGAAGDPLGRRSERKPIAKRGCARCLFQQQRHEARFVLGEQPLA